MTASMSRTVLRTPIRRVHRYIFAIVSSSRRPLSRSLRPPQDLVHYIAEAPFGSAVRRTGNSIQLALPYHYADNIRVYLRWRLTKYHHCKRYRTRLSMKRLGLILALCGTRNANMGVFAPMLST